MPVRFGSRHAAVVERRREVNEVIVDSQCRAVLGEDAVVQRVTVGAAAVVVAVGSIRQRTRGGSKAYAEGHSSKTDYGDPPR